MADRTYRLIVEGELSDDLALAFRGMSLTRADGITALTGTVRDQAELQGLLRRTSDLGLTLLEAKAIPCRIDSSAVVTTAPAGGESASGAVVENCPEITSSDASGTVDPSSVETR